MRFCFQSLEILLNTEGNHLFGFNPLGIRENQMVHIETVDLTTRGISLPRDRVGMVVCQPYLELDEHEPFVWNAAAKTKQLAVISKTLEVARARHHGLTRTHFTIFPEYSICGFDGITLIETALNSPDWPDQTFVLAGIEGLSKNDFSTLCASPNTHFDARNNPDQIQAHEWVNCSITWVKSEGGLVERWIQPKIVPAWPEQNITCDQMYRGKSVFSFKGEFNEGSLYRFSTLICFDWIGEVNAKKVWRWVLDDMQEQAEEAQAEYALSWLFVIQSNTQPSHHAFLNEVGHFFQQQQCPSVRRDGTCVVFANGAGNETPGIAARFGQTSLLFSPQAQFQRRWHSRTYTKGS